MTRARAALLPACLALLLGASCTESIPFPEFSADPAVLHPGESTTLHWTASGAHTVVLEPLGQDVSGLRSLTVAPAHTTSYTLAGTSGARSGRSAAVTVRVLEAPGIASFAADRAQVVPGATVALRWTLRGENGGVTVTARPPVLGAPLGDFPPETTTVDVAPQADTAFTLQVRGTPAPPPQTAFVRVLAAPVLDAFAGPSAPVARGEAALLTWTAHGATSFQLTADDGKTAPLGLLGNATSAVVHPFAAATHYTLTALGPTGSAARTVAVAAIPGAGVKLVYTDPPTGSEALRLVRGASSTDAQVVLELVAARSLRAYALALNLPLDGAGPAGQRDGAARITLHRAAAGPSLTVGAGGLDPGTNPPAAAVELASRGPLAGLLTLGLSQKPQGSGAVPTDASIAAGTVLCSFALDLVPGGVAPGNVFDGGALAGGPHGFRALVRDFSGAAVGTFVIGKLDVTP